MKTVCVDLGYSDEGCTMYRCGKCMSVNETRSGKPKFCMHCGAEYTKVIPWLPQNRWKVAVLSKKTKNIDLWQPWMLGQSQYEDKLEGREQGYLKDCLVETSAYLEAKIGDEWHHVYDDAAPTVGKEYPHGNAYDYLLEKAYRDDDGFQMIPVEVEEEFEVLKRRGWGYKEIPAVLMGDVEEFFRKHNQKPETPMRWRIRKEAWKKTEDGCRSSKSWGMADVTYFRDISSLKTTQAVGS